MTPARAAAAPRSASAAAGPAERGRARAILTRLARAYPDWGPTLRFANPLELLVATILAAQAQDERVNEVTEQLFRRYRSPEDYVGAPTAELERAIKPTGFFRQKTKAIKAACQGLLADFGGEVPRDLESLTRLRGVGRKTASIVLGNAFGVPAIAVDRHVARVAQRLGLSRSRDPDVIEGDLRRLFPKRDWVKATWCLVLHGRRTCRPTPLCPRCPVLTLCPYPYKTIAGSGSRGRTAGPRRRIGSAA
jgi:endonuclease-3